LTVEHVRSAADEVEEALTGDVIAVAVGAREMRSATLHAGGA